MSIMNIQSGMNSFNHNYLVSNRKKSKKADESEGSMLNGDGLVGYNIDLLNGREHLTIENLNHEIIGAESNLSLVQNEHHVLILLISLILLFYQLLRFLQYL